MLLSTLLTLTYVSTLDSVEQNLRLPEEQTGYSYYSGGNQIPWEPKKAPQKPQPDSYYIDSDWAKEDYPEVYKFVFCESSFRPKVCSYAGCYSGMGLCGFIPSTWNATLERMKKDGIDIPPKCDEELTLPISEERDEAVFDAECNLMACQWLHQTDGDSHWNSSKDCWKDM